MCEPNLFPYTIDDDLNSDLDNYVDDNELVDRQLLDQPVGQLLNQLVALGLVGPLLLQINPLVDDIVTSEPIASRPVRLRKRTQIAIEAEDEPVISRISTEVAVKSLEITGYERL
jgi:hypothetical protein